eukprot:4645478-Amphidinium_carterae.1
MMLLAQRAPCICHLPGAHAGLAPAAAPPTSQVQRRVAPSFLPHIAARIRAEHKLELHEVRDAEGRVHGLLAIGVLQV